MNKEKNIFLTTLSETKNRLEVDYFMCETPTGALAYTTGISMAEAGIKYILSQYRIDEIVMIGSRDDLETEHSFAITDLSLSGGGDITAMSEYDFVNYRITEFMSQLDFEIMDISEAVSGERQKELKTLIDEFKNKYDRNTGYREFFSKLTRDENFDACFRDNLLNGLPPDEKRWVKHYIYHEMDSFYKMHILEENRDATIRFIPIPSESALSIDTINHIVRETLPDGKADVNLYMDIQGLGAMDGNTLISTFLLMNNRTGYNCQVCGLINSHLAYGRLYGEVSNVIRNYEIQKLITGLDLFLNYGKAGLLRTYWNALGAEDPDAESLFYGMDCVDEGITLCNVDLIACGVNVIKRVINNPKTKEEDRSIYMRVIINAIISDYGYLLKGNELSIPELLKWSLRKELFQQTLTIIESKVPEDIVKRGIYYYARSKKEISDFMKELNFLYWNEGLKMRWAFGDIEHYFIKSYGRSFLDFRQKPDAVARDYARLRIDALYGQAEGMLKAYSELNNDDLLYELLLGYYRIGNLRNQVNHAVVEEPNMDADTLAQRKDNRDELRVELKKFIDLYSAACKKTPENGRPCLLQSGQMKSYARRHELKPLEESTDLVTKNTYTCSFNGKEVHICLSLFKPEPDADPEEE